LLDLCDKLLDREPGNTNAIYHKVIALAALGRGDEASTLLGLDRWLWTGRPSLACGEEGTRFLEHLRREIRTNPTLRQDPAGHATREGLRTRTFPAESDTASFQLLDAIESAIEDYADSLSGEHPFVRARPRQLGLAAWGLIFAAEGHQLHHIHPGSWLTGVFYVSAPEESPRPGRLRVGGLPAWAGVEPPWPVIEIEPEPGTLVLFPSFVPHETVPSKSTTERISVAFDAGEPAALYY